jgi:hypothetical protein
MVGIGTDEISITRRLPIERDALAPVLARLRAETSGTILVWGLGERGSCELDVTFPCPVARGAVGFATKGRLCDPERASIAPIVVSLVACSGAEAELAFHPAESVGGWWSTHLPQYLDLAHAAMEELAQELLFQHARVREELASEL